MAEGRWTGGRAAGLSFAELLRQLRAETRLTQEELAEAASLSPRSVSDLERGINLTARKDTAVLLAGALGLTGPVRELFVAAARGRAPVAEVLAARDIAAAGAMAPLTNLPAELSTFIGRDRELAEVRALMESSRLVTLDRRRRRGQDQARPAGGGRRARTVRRWGVAGGAGRGHRR